MGYRLAIAEKPSVAQSIAKVLGATKRCDGYLEGNGWLVSWCVGHLVELSEPERYDEKYSKWRYEDLPILPEDWKYEVSASTRKQFAVLKTLLNREDVDSAVNCCDSGREGENIYRLVYHQCRCQKPFERLWISSMEDSAIREGFANLRPSSDYDNLYKAALCRERADWIVGMNATRLFSCLYGQTLAVGRVMTPTLAMVVMRDVAITAFKPEPFYTVQVQMDGITAAGRKYKDRSEAEAIKDACLQAGSTIVSKVEQKEKSEKPPALYDLTSLQRDANRALGFTAQQTLDYTQNLYEKKLVTYPRTDSRYLTEDMAAMLPGLVRSVADAYDIREEVPVHTGQVIDGSKVSDHHAIIPNRSMPEADLAALPSGEQAVLTLIAARLIAAVGMPHRYRETTILFSCGDQEFTAKGKVILQPGWKAIHEILRPKSNKKKETEEAAVLPDLKEGATLPIRKADVKEGNTSSPRHFTEDTLLQAMEAAGMEDRTKDSSGAGADHAGAEDRDGDGDQSNFPAATERKGIGTPATRAATIEKLVQKGFIERRGDRKTKYLCATTKGTALITVMPEQIQSASMTADWEEKLLQIERGLYSPDSFMQEIEELIISLVKTYEVVKDADVLLPSRTVTGICPHCGKDVVERKKGWFCSDRECRFALWKDNAFFESIGKKLTKDTAEKLLSAGRVRLSGCKSKKTGKSYDATLILETGEDGKAKFRMEFGKGGGK